MADPKPINTFLLGLMVSSATLVTPSMARKNQIANRMAAKAPDQPLGKVLGLRCCYSTCGATVLENISNPRMAITVINNSNDAAAWTP